MNVVYTLVPLLITTSQQFTLISDQVKHQLGLQNDKTWKLHQLQKNKYAVQLVNFSLGFLQINKIIQDFQASKKRIQILQTAVKGFSPDFSSLDSFQTPEIAKKLAKYKQIKQQNKKLKKLLQVQLQNTEKVRQQTQKTMRVLRQQFDALVQGRDTDGRDRNRKEKGNIHNGNKQTLR